MTYNIAFSTDEILKMVDEAIDGELAVTALAIEGDTKAQAPVRGGYRSFRQGKPPIGGALRRSYTTAAPGTEGDPNGGGDAKANVRDGAILVGSWIKYAMFVDRGTSRMPARPHFSTAISRNLPLRGRRFAAEFARLANGKYSA